MTTHHNSNIHNAITLIRFTPNVTPCNVTTSWEEYRQHWLHTGVAAAVWGGRGQGTRGPAQSGEVEGNSTHTSVDNTGYQTLSRRHTTQ